MNLKEFIRKYDKIYTPYLINDRGVPEKEVNEAICEMWDNFPNPQMEENLLVKDSKIKCEYYEKCDTKYQRGTTIHQRNLWDYCRYNDGTDQHISVYRHDEAWVTNARRKSSVSCSNTYVSADWIYLELDRKEGYQKALEDALKIYEGFQHKDRMFLWFSGNNSVHVAVHASLFGYPTGKQENVCGLGRLYYNIAHKIAGDVRHNNGLVDSWLADENEIYEKYYETFNKVRNNGDISEMKQELENVDPNLFRVNSLIRQPWSKHEKSGNLKCLIEPDKSKWEENEFIFKKEFDINDKNPYLITWVADNYKAKYKKKPYVEIPNMEEDTLLNIYSNVNGFDPHKASRDGWVTNCYSPFYNDTNPSVAINIKSGWYKDHGEPTHSFNIVEFYSKLKGIDYEKASEIIGDL